MKAAIDDFKKIQDYMILAKEENAERTYAKLKDEYLSLKAILTVAGVNLTDIDKMKEGVRPGADRIRIALRTLKTTVLGVLFI